MIDQNRLRVATVGANRETITRLRDNVSLSGTAIFVDEIRELEKLSEFVIRTLPDVVVVGIGDQLSEFDGHIVVRALRTARSAASVICVVNDDLVQTVPDIYAAGIHNILLVSDIAMEFSRAISIIGGGGNYISRHIFGLIREPNIRSFYAALNNTSLASVDAEAGPLSRREEMVLKLFAFGFSTKEIAAELKVSGKTVETYKARASEKLDLRSRVAIVKYGCNSGWFSVLLN
ncbi:response regulator transcription factor [Agrobacterium rubi]|uniref:Putative LuxR family transcriptional regulator n=1 Tax=Agrobacterium rubi TR3 = NBRC 13261 TaxID=1368415 RepID=A0A081D0X2_9HYPH|nr:LuxR C-terminal-related transcriptional regulator [Agrobacterium rubi]MBP1881071.1 DNA-binding NarL/FixJ family response regulator [Agrobacterium rubi]NTF09439.1 response regulator transcription factor [Agrobacterium rubi]NTF22346.1 response regulator transcription factor [Agrobacterium rubi]NTF29203.1 response regulator transcription factor [Agrobacterium rubi]GAK72568.1 putative LuxR family transcriptional regulator [Agrobacterium rubi TR3 = NBRC 13261]